MLTLEISFHSALRIGTGRPGHGTDEVIDPAEPVRSDSLKGALRAEARLLLPGRDGQDHPFVEEVFGGRTDSPWNFDVSTASVDVRKRAMMRLDDRKRTVDGSLHVKEEVFPTQATVTIVQRRRITGATLPLEVRAHAAEYHLALLHLCARMSEKLGQRRTRGMGWVSLSAERDPEADLALIWKLRDPEELP